ncbi:MAG: DUF3592 domain-containing protein [Pontiellaceae bacterium]|nr:DUF3592 domain-containing protein [Pontiellaceae bacterium]
MRINLSKGSGIAGSLVFSAFGLFFAVMGSFFVAQEWKGLQEIKAMQEWSQTPCTIESSDVEDEGDDFKLVLSYAYTVGEKDYTGHRYSKQENLTAESITEIKNAQKQWSIDSNHTCYYNPKNPADSVLQLPNLKQGRTSIAFALIFPAIGLLFASIPWIAFFRRKKSANKAPDTTEKSRRPMLILFGLIFTLIGIAMLKPVSIDPLVRVHEAKSWDRVPATVVSSKVKSHSDDDGTTYSVYIAYRYEIDGTEYYGDRYGLTDVSSSGYDPKAAIVQQYPVGHEFSVYVDPNEPSESLINRKASLSLLFCLFPLPFIGMGLFVLIHGLRNKKPKLDMAQSREHIVELKVNAPQKKFISLLIFTSIWLGIVYILIRSDAPLLFPIVFGLVGVILVFSTLYTFLALFNPKPTAELSPGNIHPGTNVTLRWRINGRVDRIRKLTLKLKCLKVTTETRHSGGKSTTSVVKKPLFETALLQTGLQSEIAQGTLQHSIPENHPASRPGQENGIEWQIVFHGDIAQWPDLKAELPFIVYPND